MRLRPSYQVAVPPLYLLAAYMASWWLQPLPDRVWERVWWPVIIVSIASVCLPTTAWLARRSDPRWMPTTALNAAVAHAVSALLVYVVLIQDVGDPKVAPGEGIQFAAPSLPPSLGELIRNGLMAILAAAALAALLSIPIGALARAVAGPVPPRTEHGRPQRPTRGTNGSLV